MTPYNTTQTTQSNSLDWTQAMLQTTTPYHKPVLAPVSSRSVEPLREEHKTEVLAFLAARAQHTFVMTGWILDNGLISPLNRGTFYGHRNAQGQLDGVALIGHVTLFETNKEAALAEFARLAQDCHSAKTVMGEAEKVERFLSYYKRDGHAPRLMCRERLFEQRHKEEISESLPGLRLATAADLELVAPVHAQMAFEESGVNPLFVDPEGFYRRCARRIQQKRVWVNVENGELIFKADVISDTPEVIYLEGVYVSPEKRGNGLGAQCLKQLTNALLASTNSVCLLVNHENPAANACYQKAGYKMRDLYDTLYLGQEKESPAH
ncbi:MAG: GNAT family N-acetyltransferase [Pyrinomonadaceae bacterium]